MRKIASDQESIQKVKTDIFSVFTDIVQASCSATFVSEYDVELLAVNTGGDCLETGEAICQYFINKDTAETEEGLDLFCAVVHFNEPVVVVQRKRFTGKPVRLSQLILTAVNWPSNDEYNDIMNSLTLFIMEISGADNIDVIKKALKRVIRAIHHQQSGVSGQENSKPAIEETIRAVLNFVSGGAFTLEWDIVLFIEYNNVHLDSLALFNLVLEHDAIGQPFMLSLRGATIPYGFVPNGPSGNEPIRLTDLITHACTWTGGDEQQEKILGQVAGILGSIVGDDDDDYNSFYHALETYRAALHNTRLH